MAIVILTVLNDGCILSIAYDIVAPSKFPEEWRLGELALVSCLMGGIAVLSSLLVLHMCLIHMTGGPRLGIDNITYGQVITIM